MFKFNQQIQMDAASTTASVELSQDELLLVSGGGSEVLKPNCF